MCILFFFFLIVCLKSEIHHPDTKATAGVRRCRCRRTSTRAWRTSWRKRRSGCPPRPSAEWPPPRPPSPSASSRRPPSPRRLGTRCSPCCRPIWTSWREPTKWTWPSRHGNLPFDDELNPIPYQIHEYNKKSGEQINLFFLITDVSKLFFFFFFCCNSEFAFVYPQPHQGFIIITTIFCDIGIYLVIFWNNGLGSATGGFFFLKQHRKNYNAGKSLCRIRF